MTLINFAFFLIFLLGCGQGGGGEAPVVQAPVGPPFIGYGLVNGWDDNCGELSVSLATASLNLTEFEGTQNHQNTANDGVTWRPELLKSCVQLMREHNVWSFINLVNWNNCDARVQSDAWFLEKVNYVIDQIGTDRVILGGVSEPWTNKCGGIAPEKARRWNGLLRNSRWTGKVAMPEGVSFVADFVDRHFCSSSELERSLRSPSPSVLHNTDCTPVLTRNSGEFARLARQHGGNLLVYDHFGREVNHEVINSMAP